MQTGRTRPFGDKLGEQQTAFETAKRRWQRQRFRREITGRRLRKRNLVLIDIAERNNARQNRRICFQDVEKRIAHQPAGATRRQI